MDRWSDVTIGDITRALARYRPVVVSVALILAIVAFAPGARYTRPEPISQSFTPAPGPAGRATAPTTTTVVPPAPGVSVPATGGFETTAPSFDSFSGGTSFDSGSTFTGDESSAAPDTSFEPTPPGLVGADPGDGSSLAIVGSAWATLSAGTPIGSQGVPAGSLPVGKRFDQDDKRSYIRLAGQGTVLTLVEEPSGNRAPVGTGVATVKVCKATDEWQEGEGKPIDEIAFDGEACTDAIRESDGTWVIDMGVFSPADRSSSSGFALVPGDDAAIDFQVTFKRT